MPMFSIIQMLHSILRQFLYPLKTSENLNFYSLWNYQKIIGFLAFSGGYKIDVEYCKAFKCMGKLAQNV